MISIVQLKSVVAVTNSNSYKRKINTKSSLVYNEENNFEINKIINKKIISEKLEYLLK